MEFHELTFDVLYNPNTGTYHHADASDADIIVILDSDGMRLCAVYSNTTIQTCKNNIVFKDTSGKQHHFKTFNLVEVVN